MIKYFKGEKTHIDLAEVILYKKVDVLLAHNFPNELLSEILNFSTPEKLVKVINGKTDFTEQLVLLLFRYDKLDELFESKVAKILKRVLYLLIPYHNDEIDMFHIIWQLDYDNDWGLEDISFNGIHTLFSMIDLVFFFEFGINITDPEDDYDRDLFDDERILGFFKDKVIKLLEKE